MSATRNRVISGAILVLAVALFLFSFVLQSDYAGASTSLQKLNRAINEANRIEILTLSSTQTAEKQSSYKTAGYGENYFITESKTLDPKSIADLKEILSDHYLTTETSAMCHTPGQALRFYSDSSLLLDVSLCLECCNLEFYVYPFVPATVTILQKDSVDFKLPRLEAFFEAIKAR
ncbi:MAG: hypothetical protein ABL994_12290 [Verrucomicrobiales bacterium]